MRRLDDCYNIADLREVARKRLPKPAAARRIEVEGVCSLEWVIGIARGQTLLVFAARVNDDIAGSPGAAARCSGVRFWLSNGTIHQAARFFWSYKGSAAGKASKVSRKAQNSLIGGNLKTTRTNKGYQPFRAKRSPPQKPQRSKGNRNVSIGPR